MSNIRWFLKEMAENGKTAYVGYIWNSYKYIFLWVLKKNSREGVYLTCLATVLIVGWWEGRLSRRSPKSTKVISRETLPIHLYTVHYTLNILHCILNIWHCTLHTEHLACYTEHLVLYTAHLALYTEQLTCGNVHCTLHIWPCPLNTERLTLYTAHCTVAVHCSEDTWQCAL